MQNYKYILFDLDGTITDPKTGITTCFQYGLRALGIEEPELNKLERVIGPPLKDSFMNFYGLNEKEALAGVEKYRERFADIGIYENKIYDGMKELLYGLKEQGKELAVASSKPTVFVERICDYFEIRRYFHHLTGSFLDGRRSAKNEVVDAAIEGFGNIERNSIIMVGDRRYDVEGAHAGNIPCIGVEYGYAQPGELLAAGADYIAASVQSLADLLLL